jgi:serine/threonine protein kinase
MSEKNDPIFVGPITIRIDRDFALMVFPFSGLDAQDWSHQQLWYTHGQLTCQVVESLTQKLWLFHETYHMSMGDIKPGNIVYDTHTDRVRYIDLEYVTRQPVAVVRNAPLGLSKLVGLDDLTINIPDPYTRHYRQETTIGYTSYQKRLGHNYSVFENDQYALATTIYCMITGEDPPFCDTRPLDPKHWMQVHSWALEHLQKILCNQWDPENITFVTKVIGKRWGLF